MYTIIKNKKCNIIAVDLSCNGIEEMIKFIDSIENKEKCRLIQMTTTDKLYWILFFRKNKSHKKT